MIDLEESLDIRCGELVALSADLELVVGAIANLKRYELLFVSGDYSHVLPLFSRGDSDFDVRRAFTTHQLKQILEEAYHTVIFIESNTLEVNGFVKRLLQGLKEIVGSASAVVVYSVKPDKLFRFITKHVDRTIVVKRLDSGYVVQEGGDEFFIPSHKNMTLGDFCG